MSRASPTALTSPAEWVRWTQLRLSFEIAVSAFVEAGCHGLARVDFFVDAEQVLLNELNTMPGFTPTSVYGRLLEASGVPYAVLVERLCLLARERHAERRASTW